MYYLNIFYFYVVCDYFLFGDFRDYMLSLSVGYTEYLLFSYSIEFDHQARDVGNESNRRQVKEVI